MKLAGTRLGPYEIESAIGAGGMGEVYRARDTRLDRIVAIKIMAGTVALDPTFRERFDREARAISALDHPNICTLYDVGHEKGVDFLVMQFLEGESLADRLARGARPRSDPSNGPQSASGSAPSKGPIPIELALKYGAELASALDAAHRRGIVHRDLKPGNVILTKSGSKLLDFGLAKLAEQPGVVGMGECATRTVPLTGTGSIVGTLNYMSPEQLEAGTVDTRTDIFAFGCVLFEMLSGRRAFSAQSHAGLIAAILNDDPPSLVEGSDAAFTGPLSPALHRALDRLVRKCLAKNPDERWQSAADLGAELAWIDQERQRFSGEPASGSGPGPAPATSSRSRERRWIAAAVVAALAATSLAAWRLLEPEPPTSQIQFDIAGDVEPFLRGPGLMAMSQDGSRLAVVAGTRAETAKLFLRSMDSTQMLPLAGTEGAWNPFWSPDGRSIGFVDRTSSPVLRRIDLSGGAVYTLGQNYLGRGTWSAAGLIMFDRDPGGILTIPANGGAETSVIKPDPASGERQYTFPVFLPDGRRFLYLAKYEDRQKNAIFLSSLDGRERRRLIAADSSFELSGNHIIYQRDGTAFAQPFDVQAGQITGDPRSLFEGVSFNSTNGRSAIAAASSGAAIVYQKGRGIAGREGTLTWFDLAGKELGKMAGGDTRSRHLSVSPDGGRIAVSRDLDLTRADIYVIDSERGVPNRLTSDPADDLYPVWSSDGSRIYFTSTRSGPGDLYSRPSGGGGADELLFASGEPKQPLTTSPDGKLLLFMRNLGGEQQRDVWAIPLSGGAKPFPVLQTQFNEDAAVFSPDGRWLAYVSDDLGSRQIYAEPFPSSGVRIRISPTTGMTPAWRDDGAGLFYVTQDDEVMTVDVTPAGGTMRVGTPRPLYTAQDLVPVNRNLVFDPGRKRVLMLRMSSRPEATPLTVILNWTSPARNTSASQR